MRVINNLVLSGGGIKGLATCGALKRLEELKTVKLEIKNILGVSVGALIGFLYSVGYTPDELVEKLYKKDFTELIDISILSLLKMYGIDSGEGILGYVDELLKVKKVSSKITFQELFAKTGIKLQIAATNITRNCQVIFDYVNYPSMEILLAIRMSFSIPFVFSCVKYSDCVYVDGAVSDNYPIELYDNDPEHTFGIQLVSDNTGMTSESFQMYVYAIMNCLQMRLEDKCDEGITLNINANVVSTVQFDIDMAKKRELVFLGYNACTRFFD